MHYEITTLRAVPFFVGQIGNSIKAVFASESETGKFSLKVTPDQARAIGANLGKELEIEAHVGRFEDYTGPTTIGGGRVIAVHELSNEDPIDAWKKWFHACGGDIWDKVEDIEKELGR